MVRIWLTLALILLPIKSFTQTEMWVWDGVFGYEFQRINDTLVITKVRRNSPAKAAGLSPGDMILEIDGIPYSGAARSNKEINDLIMIKGGVSLTHKVLMKESSQVHDIILRSQIKLTLEPMLFFDFLVDPEDKLTIKEILLDSIQRQFCSFQDGKKTIAKVIKGSSAEALGLLPGDKMLDLDYNFRDFLEWEFNGFSQDDTIQTIQRGDSVFYINLSRQTIQKNDIISKAEADLLNKALWLRVIFHANISENRNYLLEIKDEFIDKVVLYRKNHNGEYTQHFTGNNVPLSHRDFILKDDLFIECNIEKDKIDTLYLKLYDTDNVKYFPFMNFTPRQNIMKYDRIERFITAALLGIILIIACYYLILQVYIKDRTYIFYSLFVLSIGAFLFVASGYSTDYFPKNPKLEFINDYNLGYLCFLLFNLFGISYLNLKNNLKTWYWIFTGLAITMSICLINSIIIDLLPNYNSTYDDIIWFTTWFCLIAILFLFFVPTILRIRQGYKPAWYFLAGHIILLVLLIVNDQYFPGFHSTNLTEALFSSSLYFGVIIQFLILSLGLAKKMRDTENEKKLAQERLIIQLQENERLKDALNKELEQKVKERTREIEIKNQELEEKQQEITDSITYAKRIQTATLPPDSLLDALLPEYFVFFKPRDIVSGDFYWIRQVKNYTVVVAADCTGHGVPGAFMSMLGMSLLNEQVSTRRFDDAGAILNRLRKKVKETLKQEGKELEQKDGMDLGLTIINNENLNLQFAGAFNPLYIIRKTENIEENLLSKHKTYSFDQYTLIEIKGDRQPLAIHSIERDFTTNSFQLQSGDTIYLFSDGYPDQIGGPRQKKFMSKNFKKLLLNIQEKDMAEQKNFLERTLSNWKGNVQQVDDIIVFGIRWP